MGYNDVNYDSKGQICRNGFMDVYGKKEGFWSKCSVETFQDGIGQGYLDCLNHCYVSAGAMYIPPENDKQPREDDAFELNIHVFYDNEFRDRFGPDQDKIEAKIKEIMKLVQDIFNHKTLSPKICINVIGITHLDDIFATTFDKSHGHKFIQ